MNLKWEGIGKDAVTVAFAVFAVEQDQNREQPVFELLLPECVPGAVTGTAVGGNRDKS